MACVQVQMKTPCDSYGLVSLRHTHSARQPISYYHRHACGKGCEEVRSEIFKLLSKHFRKKKVGLGSTFMMQKRVSVQ